MVLETDAPYLSPEPNRGTRNEPAFVKDTAQKLSKVMEKPIKEIENITSQNAFSLFKQSFA